MSVKDALQLMFIAGEFVIHLITLVVILIKFRSKK
ncbi:MULTISPECIES: putative holin-like toxin [Lapidilactobacillus]|uniref:Holin-like toxin n=1 Tax=Lapidilactobacillus gannanensis TaxID=2486002 RepID=A0ABW4BL28_9LACO